MDITQIIEKLKEALKLGDGEEVTGWFTTLLEADICLEEAANAEPLGEALSALKVHTRYDLVLRLVESLAEDHRPWSLVSVYTQALVDAGRPTDAFEVLEDYPDELEPSQEEERNGRYGRIFKQLYLDARPTRRQPRTEDLDRALGYYGRLLRASEGQADPWSREEPPYWLGINYVALCHHGAGLAEGDRKAELERWRDQILANVRAGATRAKSMETHFPWPWLTLAEAALVDPEQHDEAVLCFEELLTVLRERKGRAISLFELLAFERQLQELWGIDASSEIGRRILAPLQELKTELDGGSWSLEVPAKIFDKEPPLRYKVVSRLLQRGRGIARIETRNGEIVMGSGFAIARDLLLTCRHVIGGFEPADLVAVFTVGNECGGDYRVGLRCRRWTGEQHGDHLVDACLLELDEPIPYIDHVVPLSLREPSTNGLRRAYVMGHPGGGELQVSLHDSGVLGRNEHALYYCSSTMTGSSGGAVLDMGGRAVAVHARGGRKVLLDGDRDTPATVNEGVRIDSIWPSIEHHVRASWRELGQPAGFEECSSVSGDQDPEPEGVPLRLCEQTRQTPSLNAALWEAFDPSVENVDDVLTRLFKEESLWPLVVDGQTGFEFTFDFDNAQLLCTHDGHDRDLAEYGNVIINHVDPPPVLEHGASYFILHIKGHSPQGGELTIEGEYRHGATRRLFGRGLPGQDVVVAIPNTLTEDVPVQYFTFDLLVTNALGMTKPYDPLCVMVPKRGAVLTT